MEFHDVVKRAEKWCIGTQIHITRKLESEKKLLFGVSNAGVFSVGLPESGKTEWTVWSDTDAVLAHLNDVIDFASSCRPKNIADILTKANKALKPLFGATAGSDSESEDDGYDDTYEDGYYEEDDMDALHDTDTKLPESDDELSADQYFTGEGSSTAVHRLVKDLKGIKASEGKFGVVGEPKGDNLFIWDVHLTMFPKDSILGKDLVRYAQKYKRQESVHMEMKFPKDYPMAPPFVRVLRPRFKFLTGHVTVGGSVCMEMLTKSGWRPTNDIESILVQIRSEIMSDKDACLDSSNPDAAYDEAAARQAFERMVIRYGWNK